MRELDLVNEVLEPYWNQGHDKIVEKIRGCMVALFEVMVPIIGQENNIEIDKNVFVILSKALKSQNATELALTLEEKNQFPALTHAFINKRFIESVFIISILCQKNIMAREVVIKIQQIFSASCLGLAAHKERNIRGTILRFSNPEEQQKFSEIKDKLIGEATRVCKEVRDLRTKYEI